MGRWRIGYVFDPVETGVARSADPLVCAPDQELIRLFGEVPDALLWASTHTPASARIAGRLLVNPGSVTLPAGGSAASFARLCLLDGELSAEIVEFNA